jgi:hypothetical protein
MTAVVDIAIAFSGYSRWTSVGIHAQTTPAPPLFQSERSLLLEFKPAALAFVSYGFVLVRVRVQSERSLLLEFKYTVMGAWVAEVPKKSKLRPQKRTTSSSCSLYWHAISRD